MTKEMSRRAFLGTSASVALAAGIMGLAGCSTSQDTQNTSKENRVISETLETDILVVGLGASGVMAATAAGKAGAKVLAIDCASSMVGTGNVNTTAPSVYGSKHQNEANPDNQIIPVQAYKEILEETHYQENSKLLRNLVEHSGICIDTAIEAGLTFMFVNTLAPNNAPIGDRAGCLYLESMEDRAQGWERMLSEAGVETRFGLAAKDLIFDSEGNAVGIQCESDSDGVDIMAKSIILCCGGFLANEEMVAQYYAGAKMLSCGDQNAKGDGIKMALSAGAQMGKNFTVSMNEFGGANVQASGLRYTFGDLECNSALRMAIMGLLMVDAEGDRFFDEGIVCDRGMFAGEPLIRNSTYYCVCDQTFMDRVKSEPLSNLLAIGGKAAKEWKAIAEMTLTNIESDIDLAISEGWAAKGDTIAEIAQAFDLTDLEETVEKYNGYCALGEDPDFLVDASYLTPVKQAPFYLIQFNPSAWLSLGGIKTDDRCRVLNAENKPIGNLYAAGADADLWAVPYVSKGTANGFCLASGWLAGESAAASLS